MERRSKDALFDGFAVIGKALSSGRRLEVLDLLAQGERSVEEIAGELEQSVANTSHHLRVLASCGLVHTRRQGTRIFYALASESVGDLWAAVQRIGGDHLAEIDRLAASYLGDRSDLEVVDREELLARLDGGEVTVIDVRPRAEYAAGHIPGAVWVPPDDVKRTVGSLPAAADVVAYCRGRYCVYADEAVRALRRRKRRAARLEDGFPEWRRAGLPVEFGEGPIDEPRVTRGRGAR